MSEFSFLKQATPAFVFDTAKLKERVGMVRRAFGKRAKICYAVKANPFLADDLAEEVDYFEVCSPGEYAICERLHIPKGKIVLSGVYKAEADVKRTVAQCGADAVYTVESPSQLALLCRVAADCGVRLPVLFRLSSGNQFGCDGETLLALAAKGGMPLEIAGIQYYSGTQKKTESMQREIRMLSGFFGDMKKIVPGIGRIEYGPGMRVNYFRGECADEEKDLIFFSELLQGFPQDCEIVIELGRFIAAECGSYLTRVVDLKVNGGDRFCIVDGGIHHLKYYGQTMAMKIPYIDHLQCGAPRAAEEQRWTVCGSLCTTADVLVKDLPLRGVSVGDVLVFRKTGAYSVTEGIGLFLSRDLPRIWKACGGEMTLIRDFIQTNKINSKGDCTNGKTSCDFA